METFLAVLMGIGCFAVGPFIAALIIVGITLTLDRAFHKVKNVKAVKEAEKLLQNAVPKQVTETEKEKVRIG